MISAPQDGFIQEVNVQPYGWVVAGQPLLTIVPFDPASRLDLLQSQLQISSLALEPSVAQRNAIDYEQLRVDLLRLEQELAMAKANLDRAEQTLPRHQALLEEQLISRDIYEMTVRDHAYYQAEVREKSKAVAAIQERLERLQELARPAASGESPVTEELIASLQEQLDAARTNWNPILLRAPISGEVQFYRHSGEFVRRGEPILVINSSEAERIVAYLKAPMPFEPEIGMPMEVITRSANPTRFLTVISHIGARVEIITNAVAYLPAGALVDAGLPIILPVAEGAGIHPGQLVDVIPRPEAAGLSFFQRLFGASN